MFGLSFIIFSVCIFYALTLLPVVVDAGEEEFNQVVAKLEADVLELAAEVERLYTARCEPDTVFQCDRANYDDCVALFPSQNCVPGPQMTIPACGEGDVCSGLYDYTVSSVRIPNDQANGENGNPTDPEVIETVCFTRELDDWLIKKRGQDKAYYESLGLDTLSMFFGSYTGAFRIYPARVTDCSNFDPRVRPWYIAGRSGPKNVVLVLDASGSMDNDDRLGRMKDSAIHIINTLTVSDRVAVVAFNDTVSLLADENGFMYTADAVNKAALIERVSEIQAKGPTNFIDAFASAFDVLDRTAQQELIKDCNTAILFLTDGKMTDPYNVTEADVLGFVDQRIAQSESLTGNPIFLFTYSIAYDDEEVHQFPKQLACSRERGVWSKIDDASEIFDSLTGYTRLFALGLGERQNADFTAWVEPYLLATGNIPGSTVSAPVYDRTKDPPLFLGVVGIDLRLSAVSEVLGSDEEIQGRFNELAKRSTARCPSIDVSPCVLESFRRQGRAGDEALCRNANCSAADFVQVEAVACPFTDDYPTNLWVNSENKGLDYLDRVCCLVGEDKPSSQCPVVGDGLGDTSGTIDPIVMSNRSESSTDGSGPASPNVGAIAGGVIGGLALVAIAAGGFVYHQRRKDADVMLDVPPAYLDPDNK